MANLFGAPVGGTQWWKNIPELTEAIRLAQAPASPGTLGSPTGIAPGAYAPPPQWASQSPTGFAYTPAYTPQGVGLPSSVGTYQPGQVATRDYLGRVVWANPAQAQMGQVGTLPWGAFQSQMAPAEVANIYNRQWLPGQPGYQAQQQGPVTHPTAPDAGAGAGAGTPKAPQYKPIPPGLAEQAAEQGFNVPENWWQEFQAKHEGETPLEYYGAQGYGDQSLGAALHDLEWSQGVMGDTGQPPTDAEWVQHWYHKQGMMTHDEYEAYKKKLSKDRKRAKDEAVPQRPPTWQPPQVWWDI